MKYALDWLNAFEFVYVCHFCPKNIQKTNPHSYVATEGDFQSFNRITPKNTQRW